ncbi:N-acetylmuramoyl-L-alanine amidase [Paenibacillus sp. LPE1-1-1.1]
MYANGAVVNQKSNRENERRLGCALIAKKRAVVVTPSSTLKLVIDAGHGPETAGKRCPDDSMREFAFNSVVARYVRDGLAAYENVVTKFTHADDGARDVPLSERVKIANDWDADAFVSIHANAAGSAWSTAAGIETFTCTEPSATSVKMAAAVQRALIGATVRKDRGVKQADFTVVYKTKMPAILAECGFMSNTEEAALLKTDAYRKKCAAAIVTGIAEVFSLKKKAEVAPVSADKVNVIVNGKKIADGKIEDGVTYVPVRAVAEALGASVAWDGASKTVTITELQPK